MLDIDHFKSINDTYGHPVGDQVIRSLAWLLKGRLRASDIIGRYGGEEFLVVLRSAGPDEAESVLDCIRADFATLPHAHAAGTLRASFSAGIACFPAWNTGNDLTHAADEALLEAKRQGRNRIVRAATLATAR
jgi:diguanylate cyclase (GGDEF)-like protein